jgi:hypothetical protein
MPDEDSDHRADRTAFVNALGLTLMGLAALAFLAQLIHAFGWLGGAGIAVEAALLYLGWRWATRDNKSGTSGTVPPRDSPAVIVDTENPDPGQFIPGRDTLGPGENYPPPPARDESRDMDRDNPRDNR